MNNNKFTPEVVRSKAGEESVFIYFFYDGRLDLVNNCTSF